MQIRVYATLRELLGQARLTVPIAGPATVGDVLEGLAKTYPMLDGKLWDANHNLTGYVTVLLNGRSIEYLKGLATAVADTDTLALFPPVGGGWGSAQVVRELTLRGMGVAVVGMYVEDIGGHLVDTRAGIQEYRGSGWRIELSHGETVRIGSVELGVTTLLIEGPEPLAERIEAILCQKVLRAGG